MEHWINILLKLMMIYFYWIIKKQSLLIEIQLGNKIKKTKIAKMKIN